MWNEISTEQELNEFLDLFGGFHDCCLKELRYISGAYVESNLSMYPVNELRNLYIIFQRQNKNDTVIEMEFSGLVKLNLHPNDENYTCEILDTSMFFEDGLVYWGDSNWFEVKREQYDGTWLCAKKAKWRIASKYIGNDNVYVCR